MSRFALSVVPSSPTAHLPCAAALPRAAASPSLAPRPSHFSHLPVWLDLPGHHRAACPRAGVLGSRGFSVESAVARVCREAGARVSTNLCVRDLDQRVAPHDARRLEVVADGLPLFLKHQTCGELPGSQRRLGLS